MSLARLALRLAAYEALCPYAAGTSGPWPTLAGAEVFDSRIDPLEESADLSSLAGKPLLIVYTEQDIASPYGSAKYPADEQVVHLVVEMMIATAGTLQVPDGQGGTKTIGTLEDTITDRQHESQLDLLESQVRRVLDRRTRARSPDVLAPVMMEVHRIESVPQRAQDRVTRLAARTLTLTVKIKKEVWSSGPSGPIALPSPLAEVAGLLDPASSGGQVCVAVQAQIQGLFPASTVPLGSVVLTTPAAGDAALVSSVSLTS